MFPYYRSTVYHPKSDTCAIIDSAGKYEQLWQFRRDLENLGLEVLEAAGDDIFLFGNLPRVEEQEDNIIIRACMTGRPKYIIVEHEGDEYDAIQILDRVYIYDIREEEEA